MENKFKIKLNSIQKVEAILQEIYDDAIMQLNLIQSSINELKNSTNLADETIDMKAKYAKAMHDYITDKEKAVGRKLDVSKVMAEILKQDGNVEKALSEKETSGSIDDVFRNIRKKLEDETDANEAESETYITNIKNK